MKDRKFQFCRYAFYDQTAMEKHFQKMAANGWLIEKISAYLWQFRRIEPQHFHICVTYFPNASEFDPCPTEGQHILEEFAAKDGWKLLTRFGPMQVFCNTAANPTPIETDPVTQVATIYRSMKKNLIMPHLMALGITLYQLGFNGYRAATDMVEFLSTPYLLASVPIWLLLFFAEMLELLTAFRWYHKAKAAAENGVFVSVKSNRTISLAMLLSCLFVFLATIQLPNSLRSFSLVWSLCIIGIVIISHIAKSKLKKAGVSRGLNYAATIALTILLTVLLLIGITTFVFRHGIDDGRTPIGSYEVNGWTFDIYDETMPLYVEDLMDIGDSQWSKEQNLHNETFLLSKSEYRQNHIQGGPNGLKDLEYTIVDIKIPALYNITKQSLLQERQDEVHGDHIFIDHYEPIDATKWNAFDAYQLHWSDSVHDTYLICWDNRIAEIKFYWQPTPEQIKIVVDKLKK